MVQISAPNTSAANPPFVHNNSNDTNKPTGSGVTCCGKTVSTFSINAGAQPRHGSITVVGRAAFAEATKLITIENLVNSAEATKQWPDRKPFYVQGGDIAPCPVALPPGKAISVGIAGLEVLDKPRSEIQWPILKINENPYIFRWKYSQPHETRGYIALLTKDGWDASKPLSSEDFDDPFWSYTSTCHPYWKNKLPPHHWSRIVFPTNKIGHHVMLVMWIIANTGCAFYQAVDVDLTTVPKPSEVPPTAYNCDYVPTDEPPAEGEPPTGNVTKPECCPDLEGTFGIEDRIGRAAYAEETGLIATNFANRVRGPKTWRPWSEKYNHATTGLDAAPCLIHLPPGKILSAGIRGLEVLDKPMGEIQWPLLVIDKNPYVFRWKYSHSHKTRGYVALLTKDGWDPSKPLSAKDFEKVFWFCVSVCYPHSTHELLPHNYSEIVFPTNKAGHHVLLIVWMIADSPCGFYQAVDVDLSHVPAAAKYPAPYLKCGFVPPKDPTEIPTTTVNCCGQSMVKFSISAVAAKARNASIDMVGRAAYAAATGMIKSPDLLKSAEATKQWPGRSAFYPVSNPITRGIMWDDETACPIPLPSGKAISVGIPGLELLDTPRGEIQWPILKIDQNPYTFRWTYSARHKTRGYVALLTKDGWDASKPLSADDFDDPFWSYLSTCTPYFLYEMSPLDYSQIVFPTNKTGYHVLLIMWIIADGACAFYQGVDVDLTNVPKPAMIPPLTYDCDFVQDPLPLPTPSWVAESPAATATAGGQKINAKILAFAGLGLLLISLAIFKFMSSSSSSMNVSRTSLAVDYNKSNPTTITATGVDKRKSVEPTTVKKKKKNVPVVERDRGKELQKLGLYNLLNK